MRKRNKNRGRKKACSFSIFSPLDLLVCVQVISERKSYLTFNSPAYFIFKSHVSSFIFGSADLGDDREKNTPSADPRRDRENTNLCLFLLHSQTGTVTLFFIVREFRTTSHESRISSFLNSVKRPFRKQSKSAYRLSELSEVAERSRKHKHRKEKKTCKNEIRLHTDKNEPHADRAL